MTSRKTKWKIGTCTALLTFLVCTQASAQTAPPGTIFATPDIFGLDVMSVAVCRDSTLVNAESDCIDFVPVNGGEQRFDIATAATGSIVASYAEAGSELPAETYHFVRIELNRLLAMKGRVAGFSGARDCISDANAPVAVNSPISQRGLLVATGTGVPGASTTFWDDQGIAFSRRFYDSLFAADAQRVIVIERLPAPLVVAPGRPFPQVTIRVNIGNSLYANETFSTNGTAHPYGAGFCAMTLYDPADAGGFFSIEIN